MGYSSTNIVQWGIQLTQNETEQLFNYLESNNFFVKDTHGIKMDSKDLTEYPCIPNLPSHIDGIEQPNYNVLPRYRKSRFVHNIEVRSDGTDSRIHSNNFNHDDLYEVFDHFFGVYCGSKGYAYNDKIKYIMDNIPSEAKDNFVKYCEPILKKLGINKSPEVQLFSQVW